MTNYAKTKIHANYGKMKKSGSFRQTKNRFGWGTQCKPVDCIENQIHVRKLFLALLAWTPIRAFLDYFFRVVLVGLTLSRGGENFWQNLWGRKETKCHWTSKVVLSGAKNPPSSTFHLISIESSTLKVHLILVNVTKMINKEQGIIPSKQFALLFICCINLRKNAPLPVTFGDSEDILAIRKKSVTSSICLLSGWPAYRGEFWGKARTA